MVRDYCRTLTTVNLNGTNYSAPSALVAPGHSGIHNSSYIRDSSSDRGSRRGGRGGRDGRGTKKCTHCDATNHDVDFCWKLHGKRTWANQATLEAESSTLIMSKTKYNSLIQRASASPTPSATHVITGVDPNLVSKILDPRHLNKISETFANLKETIRTYGPWASAWVGESGGAYNNGGRNVSNTFVNSFWYLDQLGMAATFETKVYCRQSLIGGNYGLLDTKTFAPNPDYYSALLWHRLMGKEVIAVNTSASPYLRSYAHCSKGRNGITLLLINLSNQTEFSLVVLNSMNIRLDMKEKTNANGNGNSFTRVRLKRAVSWIGSNSADTSYFREEYHLAPKDGELQSKIMLLNRIPLLLTESGDIPNLDPVLVNVNTPMSISPLSIKFVVLPNFDASGCQ